AACGPRPCRSSTNPTSPRQPTPNRGGPPPPITLPSRPTTRAPSSITAPIALCTPGTAATLPTTAAGVRPLGPPPPPPPAAPRPARPPGAEGRAAPALQGEVRIAGRNQAVDRPAEVAGEPQPARARHPPQPHRQPRQQQPQLAGQQAL